MHTSENNHIIIQKCRKQKIMAFLSSTCLSISLCTLLFYTTIAFNKYSIEANKPKYEDPLQFPTSLRELDKPFRMAKLNILWIKAKNVNINLL